MKSLDCNKEKNLMVVYSPAGYGKTTLIQDFLSSRNLNYAWLNLSGGVDHIYTLLNYLIKALKVVNNDFGQYSADILESRREQYQLKKNMSSLINDFVKTFINEFSNSFRQDVFLVLDDFQDIEESKWVKETFDTLFHSMPANLHLIIISRQLPDFNFVSLLKNGNIFKMGMEELIFRFDEIINLLENTYSMEYSEDGVKLLENNLGGWITGIHLMLKSYGKDFSKIKLDYQLIPENSFNILANVIYRRLEPEIKSFLLDTALLDHFDEDLCNKMLCISNSGQIIEKLFEKDLFIQSIPSTNGTSIEYKTYNYNILFKKFLLSKLNQAKNEDTIKELLVKVSGIYEKRGNVIGAINYLILAKEYAKAIPIMVENFQALWDDSKYEFLWKWLSTMDSELVSSNAYLMYYFGMLYRYFVGDLDLSLQYLEKAVALMSKQNDPYMMLRCSIHKANILMNMGRTQDVINDLSKLLEQETKDDNKAMLNYSLGYAYYQNSEYDTSTKLLNEALELCTNGKFKKTETSSYNILGHINLIKGEFKKSVYFYEKVLEGTAHVFTRFETLCNLILLHSQAGRYSKANEFLSKLNDLMHNFPIPVLKTPYMLAVQANKFESGSYNENIKILNDINTVALSMNHKTHIYLSYRLLTDTYYYLDNISKARECYELAKSYVDKNNELEMMEIANIDAVLMKKEKLDNKIESILRDAHKYYNENELIYNKMQVCYHLADYYSKVGNKPLAKKYLDECLTLAREKEFISFLHREFKHSDDLVRFALDNKIQNDFVNEVVRLTAGEEINVK
jgi:ATP/maltotriose-dependent transcriptional regulator MalT